MFFMIINAVISAIFFVLVVVPPLYIYDPEKHPGEHHGPPAAGEVIAGDDVSHSVKQKLYMLFVIPACAVANVFFLYFTYYRPIRFVQYRVEVNVLDLHEKRLVARRQLQRAGFHGVPAATSTFAVKPPNTSFLERSFGGSRMSSAQLPHGGSGAAGTGAFDSGAVELRLKDGFSRRARPKNVSTGVYRHSSFYPEIRRLMEVVESRFLTPATAAAKNFQQAVSNLTGEAPPGVADDTVGFYSSMRASPAGPVGVAGKGVSPGGEQPVAGKVHGLGKHHIPYSSPEMEELELTRPQRNTSVVLVLSDRPAGGRRGSAAGDARRSGAASGAPLGHEPLEVSSGMSDREEPVEDTPQHQQQSGEQSEQARAVAAGRKGSASALIGKFWHHGEKE